MIPLFYSLKGGLLVHLDLVGEAVLIHSADSIRSQLVFGKLSALGKLWKDLVEDGKCKNENATSLPNPLLHSDDCVPRRFALRMRGHYARQLLLYDLREFAHLLLHLNHLLAHI